MNFATLMSGCRIRSGIRYTESTVCKPLVCVLPLCRKPCTSKTVKKHFLRRSGLLNKGQRFALKASEVLSSSPYSRLVDILCQAEISVNRKNPIVECVDKVDDKNCA